MTKTIVECEARLVELAERIKPAAPAPPAVVYVYADTRPPESGRLVHPGETGMEDFETC